LAGLGRAKECGVPDKIRDAAKKIYRGGIELAASLCEEVLNRSGVGLGFLDEVNSHRETTG
jgi:hypothetical protein